MSISSLDAGLTPSLLAVSPPAKGAAVFRTVTLTNLPLHSWGLPLPARGRVEAAELHRLASGETSYDQSLEHILVSEDALGMKGHVMKASQVYKQREGEGRTKKR